MGDILGVIFPLAFAVLCGIGAYIGFKERKRIREEHTNAVEVANQQKLDALSKNKPLMRASYNSVKKTLNIPTTCDKIDVETTVFGIPYKAQAPVGKRFLLRNDFYCWSENDVLFIFPSEEHLEDEHITYSTLPRDLERVLNPSDIKAFRIAKSDISYFRLSGSEHSETKVKSTDDGVNVKGAIIGGIIAGEAGAVIGSQHNKGRIYSNTEHFDDRYVELYYVEKDQTNKLKLSVTAYPLLERWYPDKEYEYVLSHGQPEEKKNDKFAEVKKYKELLDAGIISDSEFEAKKKELLNL